MTLSPLALLVAIRSFTLEGGDVVYLYSRLQESGHVCTSFRCYYVRDSRFSIRVRHVLAVVLDICVH